MYVTVSCAATGIIFPAYTLVLRSMVCEVSGKYDLILAVKKQNPVTCKNE
jgi:hypothetical protein